MEPENGIVDFNSDSKQDVINTLELLISMLVSMLPRQRGRRAYLIPFTVEAPENIAWKLSEDEVTIGSKACMMKKLNIQH